MAVYRQHRSMGSSQRMRRRRWIAASLNQGDTRAKSSLLTPDDHALLLIDHQYLQLLALRSHPNETVVNNATFLAKAAKLFKVPTLLTTAFAERQALFQEVRDVFPEQEAIDRTGLNSWDDPRVIEWVKKTGKKKLVMAGLWTEVCLSMPVIDALADGYDAYIVTDASGGGNTESHERGVQRMVQAGAQLLTTIAYVSELQRDWARPTADQVAKLFAEHGGGFGQGLRWEWQLLGLKEGAR
jgi:nicotinamidase-related amidase